MNTEIVHPTTSTPNNTPAPEGEIAEMRCRIAWRALPLVSDKDSGNGDWFHMFEYTPLLTEAREMNRKYPEISHIVEIKYSDSFDIPYTETEFEAVKRHQARRSSIVESYTPIKDLNLTSQEAQRLGSYGYKFVTRASPTTTPGEPTVFQYTHIYGPYLF